MGEQPFERNGDEDEHQWLHGDGVPHVRQKRRDRRRQVRDEQQRQRDVVAPAPRRDCTDSEQHQRGDRCDGGQRVDAAALVELLRRVHVSGSGDDATQLELAVLMLNVLAGNVGDTVIYGAGQAIDRLASRDDLDQMRKLTVAVEQQQALAVAKD